MRVWSLNVLYMSFSLLTNLAILRDTSAANLGQIA